jgi:hypothetical protein
MSNTYLDARVLYSVVWWEWFAEAIGDVANAYADWKLERYRRAA